MGSVFVVEQLSTAKQRALKLLAPSLADHPDIRERFVREAQAASAIESDHVVEIVCGGIDEPTSTPYLVMELLKGEDLSDRVERAGALTHAEVELVVSQLGHALSLAHAKGIVHRDLKPENVFLATSRRQDAAFCAKILDFGVAKLLTENSSQTGTLPVGSPAYMAPEQTDAYGNITAAADVWSLGLLAFFLLVGRSYWIAGEGGSIPALLREVCFEPIESPSERLARVGVSKTMPEGFDAWFLRCVERDIDKRFASAKEAVEAFPKARKASSDAPSIEIHPARESQPEGLVVSSPGPRPSTSRLRGPLLVAAAGAVAAAIGGLVAFMMTPRVGPTSGEEPPVAQATPAPVAPATQAQGPATDDPQREARAPEREPRVSSAERRLAAAERPPAEEREPPREGPCLTGQAHHANGFCLDRVEVSVRAYTACVSAGACAPLTGIVAYEGLRADLAPRYGALCNRDDVDQGDLPVNCVDLGAADAFCRWRGARLPTEEEWLFAARSGGKSPFPWGDAAPDPTRVNACGAECEAWAIINGIFVKQLFDSSDRHPRSAPVGSYPRGASSHGVQDLLGNVAEWVTAPGGAKARGGSYLSNRLEQFVEPLAIRPTTTSHLVGFRCASKPTSR
jgi:formylglycine-generating enzyme required for sulfatase activity/tRNA A-37 threonylcarbamoyl transferase component Bud32